MSFKLVSSMEKEYDYNVMMYFEGDINATPCVSDDNQVVIEKVLNKEEFKGKIGDIAKITIVENGKLLNLIHIGIGAKDEFSGEVLRKNLYKALKGLNGSILITGEEKEVVRINEIAEVVKYVNYRFDKYMEKKDEKFIEVEVFTEEVVSENIEGDALGEAVCITRDLINEPANVIYPESLADKTIDLGKEFGFEVEIKDEFEAEKLGMESFLSVARAAEKRPKLIIMRYKGDSSSDEIIGLVGKGLTYDTGGLSLKPTDGMVAMKSDMGGAATVIGSMTAIAKMGLKKNVTAVVAACENSIGGNAYRPGDVIGSMNGKTIEVTNTDAEGRLTLIDAITYSIRHENVNEIVDVATLTGGVIVALGMEATGIFTNTDKMYDAIEKSSNSYGELVWRLPLFDFYKDSLKSDVADLVNSAGRWGSSATAAKFLEEFVEDMPWMHLDIAGTSFGKGKDYYSKGATGKAVRAIYGYVKG